MSEQKLIKNQLLKNMFFTFIVFTIIFLFFDLIIYNQVSTFLYKSIDNELTITVKQYGLKTEERRILEPKNKTINPRLIYIIRNSNGEIINKNNIGRFYDDYLYNINFDANKINQIYQITVNEEYNYRGLTFQIEGKDEYIQLLANVDGETQTVTNLTNILIFGTCAIILISIIASYVLSKRTLEPIISSWKKQTEFVQNASHELRTPLTIIQAKQELLLQEPKAKIIDKSEDINLTLKETRRLTKLVKELMILATADSNQVKLEKEKTNINDLIREISIPYIEFAKMENKKLELNLEYDKQVNIDKSKISQLIIILLDNAIKYTLENDIIQINTYNKDGKSVIEVTDTGIGISKEGIKHIFDRFYREDKARTREKGGTGLRIINSIYNCKITWRNNKSNTK